MLTNRIDLLTTLIGLKFGIKEVIVKPYAD